ncbi:hypothetical protein GCM10007940_48150 [Portibacter lacus]|uniref:Uncharacterized protein n=1 Tax=Portibacter lacus TaxID=1099794 RepID=A0AA37SUU1_9BACT|nr:hypothetical protein GCM10007940_48150 [Portibacter lacus]
MHIAQSNGIICQLIWMLKDCSYSSKVNKSEIAGKYVAQFDIIDNLKFSSFDYLMKTS